MLTVKTVEELNAQFTKHQIDKIPEQITVDDIVYNARDSILPNVMTELNAGKKLVMLYSPKANASPDRIALVWGLTAGLTIKPVLAKTVGRHRVTSDAVMHEAKQESKPEEPTIGSKIDVVLVSFNGNKPITGKVDTGASVCSLHADSINIRKDPLNPDQQVVDFTYNGSKFTTGMEQQQSVQSADGGIEYRPLVKFAVKYDGQTIPDVLFNLNDRSQMEDKLLIGMNLLTEIGYKIDPTSESVVESEEDLVDKLIKLAKQVQAIEMFKNSAIDGKEKLQQYQSELNEVASKLRKQSSDITNEELEWILEQIDTELFVINEQAHTDKNEQLSLLYETLVNQETSFGDLLKFVKQHTITIVDNLE